LLIFSSLSTIAKEFCEIVLQNKQINLKIFIMKKLDLVQMENLQGNGKYRKCMIDGVLTAVAVGIGGAAGLGLGAAAAFVAGLFSANANGCFD
jgi:hypothetical protein